MCYRRMIGVGNRNRFGGIKDILDGLCIGDWGVGGK